jgi:hypothetical protein
MIRKILLFAALASVACGTSDVAPSLPDAGTVAPDAGADPTPDAGTIAPDAGADSTPDAGVNTPDAGSEATPDAGATTPDGGTAVPFSEAPIDFGNCPAFTPCGGDVVGAWSYTRFCTANPFAGVTQLCPTAQVNGLQGTVRGGILFGQDTVSRQTDIRASATLVVPAACANFVGGCPGLQGNLQASFPGATCTAGATGDCSCPLSWSRSDAASGRYTVAGNLVSVVGGASYEYCVAGDQLQFRQVGDTAGSINTLERP